MTIRQQHTNATTIVEGAVQQHLQETVWWKRLVYPRRALRRQAVRQLLRNSEPAKLVNNREWLETVYALIGIKLARDRLNFTICWAQLMQLEIDAYGLEILPQIAHKYAKTASLETGYKPGLDAEVEILARHWIYGPQLRQWHDGLN